MKCPICEAETAVVETREHVHGTTRRRRKCENGHKFFSVEIPLQTFTRARAAINLSFRTIELRQKRRRRDLKIANDPRPAKVAAPDYFLHHSEIGKIRARFKKGLL